MNNKGLYGLQTNTHGRRLVILALQLAVHFGLNRAEKKSRLALSLHANYTGDTFSVAFVLLSGRKLTKQIWRAVCS